MRILDVVKPDLLDVRNVIAAELRVIRKRDRAEAQRRLKRFQLGMACVEADLNRSLLYGNSGGSGLSGLLVQSPA